MHSLTSEAVKELGQWVAGLTWSDIPIDVRERHRLIWADSLAVVAAGAQLAEYEALLRTWPLPEGPVPIPGTQKRTSAEVGAWLIGTAGVALEQDEGNKYAKGHPAAHVLPAVFALGVAHGVGGEDCAVAVAAGYEVAARFGRAVSLAPGVHPHGNWGVAAAAAGCARLLGLDAAATAAAIDHGSGMAIAGHFTSALDGNLVRNSWMGAAQVSGIVSAWLAASGLASCTGTAAAVFGETLGTWDPAPLTEELGERWDARSNYFKLHAACSFTHPPIDAVLALAEAHPELRDVVKADIDHIVRIDVDTHCLATGLTEPAPASRLGAMFSIPYVVAVALLDGQVSPEQHDPDRIRDPYVRALAARVFVHHDPAMSARLPGERAARARITFADGGVVSHEVPNPVGDSDYRPLLPPQLQGKAHCLLGAPLTERIWDFAERLPISPSVTELADLLVWPHEAREVV